MKATPLGRALDAEIDRERAAAPATDGKPCRSCRELTAILHHDPDRPDDVRRSVCGRCQGEANRRIVGNRGARQ